MSTETRLIFSGNTVTDQATLTDGFNDLNLLYIKAPNNTFEVEVDAFLQVYLSLVDTRMIKLVEPSTFTTEIIYLIPQEYRLSGFNQRLAMYFSEQLFIQVYGVKVDCCLQTELNQINSTVNNINRIVAVRQALDLISLAGNVAAQTILTYLGGLIVGTAARLILPAAVRAGFYILNPVISSLPVTISLTTGASSITQNLLSPLDYILNPGEVYLEENNYQGDVLATSTGDTKIIVQEFY